MLVIRKDQIQHFIAPDEAALTQVVASSVRAAVGDRVADYDDAELGSMVEIGIERARKNKLTQAEDIAAFVAVMFEVAPRFDEQPEIRQVLDDALLTPELAFYQIFDRVPDTAWTDLQKRYDDSFWFTAGQ